MFTLGAWCGRHRKFALSVGGTLLVMLAVGLGAAFGLGVATLVVVIYGTTFSAILMIGWTPLQALPALESRSAARRRINCDIQARGGSTCAHRHRGMCSQCSCSRAERSTATTTPRADAGDVGSNWAQSVCIPIAACWEGEPQGCDRALRQGTRSLRGGAPAVARRLREPPLGELQHHQGARRDSQPGRVQRRRHHATDCAP